MVGDGHTMGFYPLCGKLYSDASVIQTGQICVSKNMLTRPLGYSLCPDNAFFGLSVSSAILYEIVMLIALSISHVLVGLIMEIR